MNLRLAQRALTNHPLDMAFDHRPVFAARIAAGGTLLHGVDVDTCAIKTLEGSLGSSLQTYGPGALKWATFVSTAAVVSDWSLGSKSLARVSLFLDPSIDLLSCSLWVSAEIDGFNTHTMVAKALSNHCSS